MNEYEKKNLLDFLEAMTKAFHHIEKRRNPYEHLRGVWKLITVICTKLDK